MDGAAAESPAWPGSAIPLGATWTGSGTNFAVFSAAASTVDLCLFDENGVERRIALTEVDSFIWHAFLPGVGPGQRYGYRVDGPWSIQTGDRCNPAKLLLDPYSLAIEGAVCWGNGDADEALFDRRWADNSRSPLDSAPLMPRSVVVDQAAHRWEEPRRPNRPLSETVLYECHVKGMTAQHPAVPVAQRGTYAGLAHPAVLAHLRGIGVTAVELMPVHQFVSEQNLIESGLVDYWGYNTIGFFAPHNAYSGSGQHGEQVGEFKAMVESLHAGDLEVILDVVYNHTAEGGTPGPSFSFRGFDHRSYYLLKDNGETVNDTGTGNTLNIWDPAVLRLVLDSLRYWVQQMHVDGFRFDLASALATTDATHSVSVFLDLIAQDPVLATVKLIAEPWNVGPDGSNYLLGRFPPGWSQWNDQFRGTVRDTWRSMSNLVPAFRNVFEGTPTAFDAADGETPSGSVNYLASHDGFTLRDLVSYNSDDQRAWDSRSSDDPVDLNHPSDPGDPESGVNPVVRARRATRTRAMLMTVLLAQGLPMIAHGDELGRTQLGNPNAYDRDDASTWVDWAHADAALIAFTGRLAAIRRDHPVFRQPRFATADGTPHGMRIGLGWYAPSGAELTDGEPGDVVTVTVFLDGDSLGFRDPLGCPVVDDSFLLIVNAWWGELAVTIPPVPLTILPRPVASGDWVPVLDSTAAEGVPASGPSLAPGATVTVAARSALLLQRARGA